MTYDIIIFSDISSKNETQRGMGAYKIAHEARQRGYSALVIDFSSAINYNLFTKLIDLTVGDNTQVVGFSNTWFPYKLFNGNSYVTGMKADEKNDLQNLIGSLKEDDRYISSLSYNFSQNNIKPWTDYIKKANPNVSIVTGGAKSFEYLHDEEFDKVFMGYSENQFLDFLKGKPQEKVVCYDMKAHNGDFNFNSSKVSYVDTDIIDSNEILTIEMSRGCIFNCVFCSYPHRNQNTKQYTKYQDVLYEELKENYDKWGVYQYYITDDTFNDYTPKLELIKEVIQSLDFNPKFEAYVRMDLVAKQKQQAKLMFDIGVKATYFGFETWNNNTSKIIKKGGNRETKLEGMKQCKSVWGNQVYVSAGYVIGLPEDTEEDVYACLDWYKKEGFRIVNNMSFNALIIKHFPNQELQVFNSDIDLNPTKYNYKMNGLLNWTRNDTGNIKNFQQAMMLQDKANRTVSNINRLPPRHVWDAQSLYTAYCDHFELEDFTSKFYYYVENYYFPKLLEKLNG